MCGARAAYVHVPFCRHRCGYCNFSLVANRDDLIPAYLKALELELSVSDVRPVETLFLGGGTPSHLSTSQLRQLLQLVTRFHPLRAGGEFSVEVNPSDVDQELIAVLSDGGVTRISLGVQSFDREKLRLLERDHDGSQARRAVELARTRFNSISMDLIFGTPSETLAGWRKDLQTGMACGVEHLSTYGLTVEQGSGFYGRRLRGELPEIAEELDRQLYLHTIDVLTAEGYEHYEVSSFARGGHRCRHNQVYWSGDDYWAAGPGAARFIDGRREVNHRSPTTWLKRLQAGLSPVFESEQLDSLQRARDQLVFGLRRLEGVRISDLQRRYGHCLREIAGNAIDQFLADRLLRRTGDKLQLTRAGLLVSDAMWEVVFRR